MKIRKFKKSDAQQVCEIIKRNDLEITSKDYPSKIIKFWFKETTSEYVLKKSKDRICFVFLDKKNVVGYISFKDNEIMKLFVNPDYHGRGIGKRLEEKIEGYARKNKIKNLIVRSNIGSQKFYEKCGFRKTKIIYGKIDAGKFKEILMEKKLK